MKLYLIAILLLVVGCVPVQECPQVTCPTCQAPAPQTLPNEIVFAYSINVGQGDATLIKSGETEMLIDCGPNGAGPAVTNFLKDHQVSDLEYMMITHPDSDHLGGCDDVLKEFKTHAVIVSGHTADTISYRDVMDQIDTEQLLIASAGNSWDIGPAELRIIQANNGFADPNQNSIVTKLTYGNTDVLYLGDCDRECEDILFSKNIQSEVIKVAHHGSKYGTELDFLEKVLPSAAIISAGAGNSYGHPAPEVLDRLTQQGIVTYRTDTSGDITISINSLGYEIIP